jgi:hypothetical protein
MGMPVLPCGGIDPEAGARWVARSIDRTRCAPVRGRVMTPRPPAAPESPEDDPVGTATRIVLVWLASRLPAAVAARALEAGADRAAAEQLFKLVAAAAEEETRALFEEMNLSCPLHADWTQWRMPSFEPMPEAEADQPAPAGRGGGE